MFKRILAAAMLLIAVPAPAHAHVKWFLDKSEAQLLAQPKPELFTRLSAGNASVMALAAIAFYCAFLLNRRLSGTRWDRQLRAWFAAAEPVINLFMGLFTGLLLIKCALDMTFFVPSLHLHHCCSWIAKTEAIIGVALCVGFLTRAAAAGMLFLLLFGLVKFSVGDCADLLPMYGIGAYFLIVGRGHCSLDRLLGVSGACSLLYSRFAYTMLRFLLGGGLAYLGLDEKLLNPQLALDLVHRLPTLNFLSHLGMANDLFVLCSGTTEVMLGLMLLLGIFPRFVVIALGVLFAATTGIFGMTELFGHMPYYGIMVAILLRGAESFDAVQLGDSVLSAVRPFLTHPARAIP